MRRRLTAVSALVAADVRRQLNMQLGLSNSADQRRLLVVTLIATGAAAAVGVCALLGGVLGTISPVTASPTEVSAWLWAPSAAYLLIQLLHADPATARSLVAPRDREVLRTLPVSLPMLVTARLIVPGLAVATAGCALGAAIAVPWLTSSQAGTALLCPVLLNLAGVLYSGALMRMLLIAWLMRPVVRVAHLQRCVLAVLGGAIAGAWVGPVLRALGDAPDTASTFAARRVEGILATGRPALWADLFDPGAAPWTAVGYSVAAAALVTTTLRRVRTVEHAEVPRRSGLEPGLYRGGIGRISPTPSGAQTMVLRLAWLRLNRADPAVVGGAARLHRFSLLVGAACIAAVARLGEAPWKLPVPALVGVLVTLAFVATSEVVQVCGIESEPRTWELLRQTALPSGAWPAARTGAAALGILTITSPCYLGIAVLCGTSGSAWLPVALALPVVALGAGGGLVLTWYAVPRTERFENGRVQRHGSAEIVEGILTIVLLSPATAGCLASYTFLSGSAADWTGALAEVSLLVAFVVTLAKVRDAELPSARVFVNPRRSS
ncbi:hypothetical protein [Kitasatospora sp. NPDC089509]|uniref:hypothetical protein n=1 Tax=Kitasatospora sp. NPDC089509 TaxID=3364079 RepID=UPI00382F4C02